MQEILYIELNPESASKERRSLYQQLWYCGFRRMPRKRKGWRISLVPRTLHRDPDNARLKKELEESPAVKSWEMH